MDIRDFNYELPKDRIALSPIKPRDHSRLMVVSRHNDSINHHCFYELENLLSPGDLLVLNNSRVIPARLKLQDLNKRFFEVLLTHCEDKNFTSWSCLIKPVKKIGSNLKFLLNDHKTATLTRNENGFVIHFPFFGDKFWDWLSENGSPPLPPYIKRNPMPSDREDYQTVFAKKPGSIAAPTAGLHFTPSLLERLRNKGINIGEITLHVGTGTFQPIRVANIKDHRMHQEYFHVSQDTYEKIVQAKEKKHRVICVGTTSLRALESIHGKGFSGQTDLFILPGYSFQLVDGLITNFHLPRSTLYMLVSSFLGLQKVRHTYKEAIHRGYRFYSYGDAMMIL